MKLVLPDNSRLSPNWTLSDSIHKKTMMMVVLVSWLEKCVKKADKHKNNGLIIDWWVFPSSKVNNKMKKKNCLWCSTRFLLCVYFLVVEMIVVLVKTWWWWWRRPNDCGRWRWKLKKQISNKTKKKTKRNFWC